MGRSREGSRLTLAKFSIILKGSSALKNRRVIKAEITDRFSSLRLLFAAFVFRSLCPGAGGYKRANTSQNPDNRAVSELGCFLERFLGYSLASVFRGASVLF